MDIVNLLILLGCVILSEIKTFPCCIFLNGNHKKIKIARVPLEEEEKSQTVLDMSAHFPPKNIPGCIFAFFFSMGKLFLFFFF